MGLAFALLFGIIAGLLFYSSVVQTYEGYKRRKERQDGNADNSL